MNINVPGLSESLSLMRELPQQFDQLIKKLEELVALLETTNQILERIEQK